MEEDYGHQYESWLPNQSMDYRTKNKQLVDQKIKLSAIEVNEDWIKITAERAGAELKSFRLVSGLHFANIWRTIHQICRTLAAH